MLKEDLVKLIQDVIPDGTDVAIFDHHVNLEHDYGEGSTNGIYRDFEVYMMTEEMITKGAKPFGVLSFDNEDFDKDSNRIN